MIEVASSKSFRGTSHVLGSVTLTGRLVADRIGSLLEPLDLTHAQAVALVRLWRSPTGSVPQTEMIDSLAVSRASGSQLLQDLEARGLVVRRLDKRDARRQVIFLTDAGVVIEQDVLEVFDRVEQEFVNDVDIAGRRSLDRVLGAMLDRAREMRGGGS